MHPLIVVLLFTGIALVVFSAVGVLLMDEPLNRLHFVTPASTLGTPLVCLAVMLDLGHERTTAKVAVILVLLVVVQPAITSATGRALAAARGLVTAEDET